MLKSIKVSRLLGVSYLFLLILNSCESVPECNTPNVELEVTDTRSGRSEGVIEMTSDLGINYNYAWDGGGVDVSIDGLAPGRYCVTITQVDSPDCQTTICQEVQSKEDVGGKDLDDGTTKILFIGNSHTFYNNLPTTVSRILDDSKLPKPIIVKNITPGGWRFEQHAEDQRTIEMIKSDNWDFVVLQENASYASYVKRRAEELVYPFAENLFDQVIDNNPDTEIILYMTHAYEDGLDDCESNPTGCSYELMQNEIRRNYLHMGKLIESQIAPAGILWKIILSKNESLNLFADDKIHPSREGSQVSAATVATIISKERLTAEELDSLLFDQSESILITDIINQALFDGDPDWKSF